MFGNLYTNRWIQLLKDLQVKFPDNDQLEAGISLLEDRKKLDPNTFAFAKEIYSSLEPYEKTMNKPFIKWTFLMSKEVKILSDLGLPPRPLTKKEFQNLCIHIQTLYNFAKYMNLLNFDKDDRYEKIMKTLMIENFTSSFNFKNAGKQPNFSELGEIIRKTLNNKKLLNEIGDLISNYTLSQTCKLLEPFGVTLQSLLKLFSKFIPAENGEDPLSKEFFSNSSQYNTKTLKSLLAEWGASGSISEIFEDVCTSFNIDMDQMKDVMFKQAFQSVNKKKTSA